MAGVATAGVVCAVVSVQLGAFAEGGRDFLPAPSQEEALLENPDLAEAVAAGTPVYVAPASTPDPDAKPSTHGQLRLVPDGFVGSLPVRTVGLPDDRGVATDDPDLLRESQLWFEPDTIPVGYSLVSADTFDGMQTSNVAIRAVYGNEDGDFITVNRRRPVELPVDYLYNPVSPTLSLEIHSLANGSPVVLLRPTSEESQREGGVPDAAIVHPDDAYKYAAFFDDTSGVLTAIETFGADGVSADDLISILEGYSR